MIKNRENDPNIQVEPPKPGQRPVLGLQNEKDLSDWIIGMQKQGYPATKTQILVKGNLIYQQIHGVNTVLRGTRKLKIGWLNRFMQRHHHLAFVQHI